MKILKTKWYLAEKDGDHFCVLAEYGPFPTEREAFGSMYRTAAIQDPNAPSQRLQERKPEWEKRRVTTVRGARILQFPRIYHTAAKSVNVAFFTWQCDRCGKQENQGDIPWTVRKDEHGSITRVLCPECAKG